MWHIAFWVNSPKNASRIASFLGQSALAKELKNVEHAIELDQILYFLILKMRIFFSVQVVDPHWPPRKENLVLLPVIFGVTVSSHWVGCSLVMLACLLIAIWMLPSRS